MNVLVINTGSSSIKFGLFQNGKKIIEGVIDQIGNKSKYGMSSYVINGEKTILDRYFNNYELAVEKILEIINNFNIDKVAYRVVYDGKEKTPLKINEKVLNKIKNFKEFAPLHIIPCLKVIEILMKKLDAEHYAVSDSAFHSGMPEHSKIYGIPYEMTKRYNIYRNGFHGISHSALFREAEKKSGKKFNRVITCQLGNGASVCAIKNGKSVDTSMGITPMEGLMMGTRAGNVDSYIIKLICEKEKVSVSRAIEILEKDSGFRGFVGESDVRMVLEKARKGNKNAEIALDIFCYQVRKYIGAYVYSLGGVDAIVFGGGLSRSHIIREKILKGLEKEGINIDFNKKGENPGEISKNGSKVRVFVFEVDEQEEMRRMMDKGI